jgi:MYND finger
MEGLCDGPPTYDAIIPTMAYVSVVSKEECEQACNAAPPSVRLLICETVMCVMCRIPLYEQEAIFAVRILIDKGGIVVGHAVMCLRCAPHDSNACTVHATLAMQRAIVLWMSDVFEKCMHSDVEGPVRWTRRFIACVNERHLEVMRCMSQTHRTCAACGEKSARKIPRCTGCHLFRYCNSECSAKDWPRHKQECLRIREMHFFCTERAIRL